jgi:hypothetical protein
MVEAAGRDFDLKQAGGVRNVSGIVKWPRELSRCELGRSLGDGGKGSDVAHKLTDGTKGRVSLG